jgi:ribonuclease BN (tRNA processing enzyme)
MSFSVTVLGSSGMFASIERACAGYLVDVEGSTLWLDAGAGTWRNLLAHTSYATLDGIFLTHRHPDHTTDFFQAFHARQYGQPEPLPPIPVWAPAETLERVTAFIPDIDESFDLNVVAAGDRVSFGEATLSLVEMAHPPETVGVRLDHEAAAFAYSSDTGIEADFGALATNVDLFLCEATLQDSDETWSGHLRASQVGEIAQDLGAKRVCLTHLPPGRDHDLSLKEAHAASGGVRLELATDNMKFELGT